MTYKSLVLADVPSFYFPLDEAAGVGVGASAIDAAFGNNGTYEGGIRNLLTANQSSLEADTTGWGGYGVGAISRVVTPSPNGIASLKVIVNNADSGGAYARVAVAASTTYTLSIYVRGSTAQLRFRPILLKSDGTGSALPQPADSIVLITDDWQRITYTVTTHFDVALLDVWIVTYGVQTVTFYVDAAQVERASVVSPWTLGGSTALPDLHATSIALPYGSPGAPRFDGNVGYVNVPDNSRVDLGDVFTLEAWVYLEALIDSSILAKNNNGYQLSITSAGKLALKKYNVGTIVESTTILSVRTLYHVVATKSGSSVALYINDANVTGTITPQTIVNNASALLIGRDPFFNGYLSHIAGYPFVLAASQRLRHYLVGSYELSSYAEARRSPPNNDAWR